MWSGPRNISTALMRSWESRGDTAVWDEPLYAHYLEETGVSIAYTCEMRSFSARRLERALPEGTVLLSGGGNLGDLWPTFEEFRERVVRSLPGHRLIQLPQIWKVAIPGLGNLWQGAVKDTALVSIVGLDDLLRKSNQAAQATREPFTFYFAASLMFLAITLVSMAVIARLERRARRGVPER